MTEDHGAGDRYAAWRGVYSPSSGDRVRGTTHSSRARRVGQSQLAASALDRLFNARAAYLHVRDRLREVGKRFKTAALANIVLVEEDESDQCESLFPPHSPALPIFSAFLTETRKLTHPFHYNSWQSTRS